MAKMIQLRNVPERLQRELMHRAQRRGQSLTEFIEEILEREVSQPPIEEVLERIKTRERVDLKVPVAEIIRAERRRARRS